MTVTLPPDFEYVLAAAVGTFWLNFWQFSVVVNARAAAEIAYPQFYAEKAEMAKSPLALKFNCAQRAHGNTLEAIPHILLALFVTGLEYPKLASGLVGTWLLGRVIYTNNYTAGNPEKRNSKGGALGMLSYLALMLTSTWTVGKLIVQKL